MSDFKPKANGVLSAVFLLLKHVGQENKRKLLHCHTLYDNMIIKFTYYLSNYVEQSAS